MPNNEFGDFQTPDELAKACVALMSPPANARIFEPTCGQGSFLKAAKLAAPESERRGWELNPEYAKKSRSYADVVCGDFFQLDPMRIDWRTDGPLFIIGNPPWVTSADLKRMGSGNLPKKENFKHAEGYEALLGSSNFDVCEYMILKLLGSFRDRKFRLGMLCKTQVARNVIEFAAKKVLPVRNIAIHRIDAKKWFNASVDACWLMIDGIPDEKGVYEADVYDDLASTLPVGSFGMTANGLVSDLKAYRANRNGIGTCPYEWRSGLKHDAAKVFELKADDGEAVACSGERLKPDGRFVLPLLKSTDVFRGKTCSRYVIVPQLTFGGGTEALMRDNPAVWSYLEAHGDAVDARKSSVYRGKPRFTVFGHGDYTYAPYKVAVSGLHKGLRFRLVPPLDGAPVVLDDTCYFLPFDDPTEACVVLTLLNSPQYTSLASSLVFWDSKRPITKKLLSRINMFALESDDEDILRLAAKTATCLGLYFDEGKASRVLDDGRLDKPAPLPV